MGSKYRYFKAEGQEDKNACWAASLAWWLRATNKGNYEQWDLMSSDEYSGLWDTNGGDGTISENGIRTIIQDTRWRMDYDKFATGNLFTESALECHLDYGPVYIGYYDQKVGGNHVNVIYDLFGSNASARVSVMEPGWKKQSNGTFKGKHLARPLAYYQNGVVIVGSPMDEISLDR